MILSIVVPCYNEALQIVPFCNAVKSALSGEYINNYEIIFVDDGSTDETLIEIDQICQATQNVTYISFSRNFGKEAAMFAGMEAATGDYTAIMDVDLQDPPTLLPNMMNMLKADGCDCVATRRVTRKGEPAIRSCCARMFYRIINKISDVEIVDGARDFRLMTRQMVNAILEMPERSRFSKGIFAWIGFKTEWLEYENIKRASGQTKWSFWKLFLYSLDGIIAFSTIPLALSSIFGIAISAVAFLLGLYFIVQKIFVGIPVQGYAAMIVIILFMGGIQLFCMGIVSQYIAKIYIEAKQRPLYIIKTSSDIAKNKDKRIKCF